MKTTCSSYKNCLALFLSFIIEIPYI